MEINQNKISSTREIFFVGILVITAFILIYTSRVSVPAEYFFYPWLISKGQLPYKDFFINHGFLSYLIQIPLISDTSLSLQISTYRFYLFSWTIFFIIILRKYIINIDLLLVGLIFIFLQYYFGLNHVWDEIYITPLYVVIYLLVKRKKFTGQIFLISLLISLCTLIKPSTGIVIIPVLIALKKIRIILFQFLVWIIIGLYYLYNNGYFQLIDNLYFFNRFYGQYFIKNPMFLVSWGILIPTFLITTLVLIMRGITNSNKYILLLGFFISSWIISFVPCCAEFHFTPYIAFFCLLVADSLSTLPIRKRQILKLTCILLLIILTYKINGRYNMLITQIDGNIQDSNFIKITELIKNEINSEASFYVLGNQVDLYYLLDRPIKMYFPIIFPFMNNYYPNLQHRIISDLNLQKIQYIISFKPADSNYHTMIELNKYITTNFYKYVDNPEYTIYCSLQYKCNYE